MIEQELHNVIDRRRGWLGSWVIAPIELPKLSESDIGRTVIYQDHNRREAGTLVSWNGDVLFARFTTGDTAAGCKVDRLLFGIRPTSGPEFK